MERHLPYDITQCYLPQATGECSPILTSAKQADNRLILDLPTPKGWKAELTLILRMYWDGLRITYSSSNLLIVTWPRVKPTTSLLQVWHPTVAPWSR